MHARGQSGNPRQRPVPFAAGAPAHREALRLLAEQGAIPADQLGRFLGLKKPELADFADGLECEGLIERRRLLVREPEWIWPSSRALRSLELPDNRSYAPTLASLNHRRAVNEVRLYLRRRSRRGRWVCESDIGLRRNCREHIPDGVFEVGGERHAIEAELSNKTVRRLHHIVAQHSDRYDAVIYFCAPSPLRLLKEVQGEGRWPKLLVRKMPGWRSR